MQRNKVILILFVFIVTIILSVQAYFIYNSEKIIYVDTATLFDEFALTKALKKEYKKVELLRINELDSMMRRINHMQLNEDKYKELTRAYSNKEQEYASANDALRMELDMKIWKQLNQYIKEYARSTNASLIIGNNDDGTVLYNDNKIDHTQALIKYVNQQYFGGKVQ